MTSNSVDIFPAEDRGSFVLTDEMLMEQDATTMEAFQVLLLEEARRRGLEVSVSERTFDGAVTVSWRPDKHADLRGV